MSGRDALRDAVRRVRWDLVVVGYCTAIGAGLGYALLMENFGSWNEGLPWERAVMARVHASALPPAADWVMVAAPWLGTNWTALPIAVALSIWLGYRRRWDLVLPIMVIQFGSNTLNALIKHIAWRERPELWEKRGQFAWPSYPSGHAIATMSVLLFLTILLVRERGVKWAPVLVAPVVLLVLYSRLYLGVHWPTDVVGGVLIGVIWLFTILRAFPLPDGSPGSVAPEQPALATDVGRTGGA